MKILIYGLNFSPELVGIGKYTGELAQTLAQKGHKVTVITTPPYYPAWQVNRGYDANRYTTEERANLKTIRCPLWVPKKVSGTRRILHLFSFAFSSAPILLREARKKPDLIFTVAPAIATAPAAAILGKLLHIPTWLHVQDFEIESAFNLGIIKAEKSSQEYKWLHKIEVWTYKQFCRVSSITPKMVNNLKMKGVKEDDAIYFPNWVDPFEIKPETERNGYYTNLRITEDDIVVLYSGSMSEKQGIEVILESARQLSNEKNIQFVLCGDGPAKQELLRAGQSLNNLHFLPLQPTDKLNQLLNIADIHLLPQKRGVSDLVMPSKLLGMLASGKCVVAGCMPGSVLYEIVSKIGVVVEPEKGTAFSTAIKDLANNPNKRIELGAAGRVYCIEHFSRDMIIDKFIAEAEKLLYK